MSYRAPVRDLAFTLEAVAGMADVAATGAFPDYDSDVASAVLEAAGQFSQEVLAPLNRIGDQKGSLYANGAVTAAPGFADAYRQFAAGGWTGLSAPVEAGGQALPKALELAAYETVHAANMAFGLCPMLSLAAIEALEQVGTEEQKATYLTKLVSGEWTGAMVLTEPGAGSDLGSLITTATPNGDGTYAIHGQKIFITWGDHDATDNILHLVLARLPDAPSGPKGISLFVASKYDVRTDGTLGERNTFRPVGIEHKLGIHASPTCVMAYEGARAELVGRPNEGLAHMFVMMNAARLGVGIQGLGQADVAFQNAVQYAQDRRQGRALTGPQDPQEKADHLFVHPDVRRMLMDGKAVVEGLRALCLWGALQVDLAHAAETEEERQHADDLVSLLTPVIKGYGTDKGYEVATNAQQVFGGHGYIEEQGMSQYVRDARITMIYEGANGVQAMDLVGRKLAQNGGRAIQTFFAIVDAECAAAKDKPAFADFAGRLEKANGELKAATMWFMQNGMTNPNNIGAGAHHYMHIMGIVALGLMWLRMAEAAQKALDDGRGNKDFLEAKIVTARHFGERFVPDAGALRRKIEAGSEAMMSLTPEQFFAA